MHNCDEFRERISETRLASTDELLICEDCSEFYEQAQEMFRALNTVDVRVSPSEWNRIEQRLHLRIMAERSRRRIPRVPRFAGATAAAAAALLVFTLGFYRLQQPALDSPDSTPAPAFYVDHVVPLDPGTVDFLQDSELLLRNVMNIEPQDSSNLEDVRKAASEQLGQLAQRKEAAADAPPVVGIFDTYETILRDLRNVDRRNVDEDLGDIQQRIRQNGLIASMKAFQPVVTEVSFTVR
jgi:hypothetical protein